MFAAVLTTLCWSIAALFSQRSIRVLGVGQSNLGRLIVAVILLGAYAHFFGLGMGGAGRDAFLLSGIIGMGLGDLALFAALHRLGTRLTILICQCVAVPIAMVAEWGWLDTHLSLIQIGWAAVILVGVTIALMPFQHAPPKVPVTRIGIALGLGAAFGQGIGAVISRRAYEITTEAGMSIDGITAAYQRISWGLAITAGYFIFIWLRDRRQARLAQTTVPNPTRYSWRGFGFLFGNAIFGPILGVSCYQ